MLGFLTALVLSVAVTSSPCQADRPVAERELMRMWGQSISKTMPASVKKGGTLKQLQHAFNQYCNALEKRGITHNDSLTTRVYNLFKEGSRTKWTCGDHSTLLESLFAGMGIPGPNLLYLKADSQDLIPTTNRDHGALAVLINGKLFVFDAWQVARLDGSYDLKKHPERQRWGGMDSGMWELQMLAQGYQVFSLDDREPFGHIAEALEELIDSRKGVKPPAVKSVGLWVPFEDPKIIIDYARPDCTIKFDERGHLVSTAKWGYPAHPGVSPLDFKVDYDIIVPDRLRPGEKGEVKITLRYDYIQKDLNARGYTMSVEVHAGQFPLSSNKEGGWMRNVGATNFLKVVAACNDESPHRGGVLHPVIGKQEIEAPPRPANTKGPWYFALQFYIYGAAPTARVIQVYRLN